MPYKNNSELPSGVKDNLPGEAQTIYRKAFNSAFDGTCKQDDACASKVAWSAVKNVFTKKGDNWVKSDMEISRKQLLLHYDWQFMGECPNVPLNKNVDMATLTEIEPDGKPMFITLPIARDNLVASDGFKYTPEVNDALLSALQNEGITGNMGHIAPEDRSSAYPMPVSIWVGAMKDAMGTIWAKAYVSDPTFKSLVRQLKATNSQISTSIYASYDPSSINWGKDGSWQIDPSTLSLEHLDFAPPKRAALQFERQFAITDHMIKDEDIIGEENMPTKEEILAQMTPEEVPSEVRKAIIDGYVGESKSNEKLTQMETELTEARSTISQMASQLTSTADELFSARIEKRIEEAIKLNSPSLYDYVKTKVVAQMATLEVGDKTVEKIDEVILAITETDVYKGLASAVVAQMGGGKVAIALGNDKTNSKTAGELMEENFESNMFANAIRS